VAYRKVFWVIFDEYVTAFNHIADLGELSAIKVFDEDEDAAVDLISLSLGAEQMLKLMEDMGGALDEDEEAMLEEVLADAMEDVFTLMEEYGLFIEDDEDEDDLEEEEDIDDEDDYEGNPFLDAAAALREAKGAKKGARPPKGKKRFVLKTNSREAKKGASKWGKGSTKAKKQIVGRGDVRNKEGLLGYLKLVKRGLLAPGQPIMKDKKGKPMNKGARAAVKAAGKKVGYGQRVK
jgi:hypothetical protein